MSNPFDSKVKKTLKVPGFEATEYTYYSLPALADARLSTFALLSHTYTLLWLIAGALGDVNCSLYHDIVDAHGCYIL